MQHFETCSGIRGGVHWSLLEPLQKEPLHLSAVIESGDLLEIETIIFKCSDLYYEELYHLARGNSHITLIGLVCYKLWPMTAEPIKDYQDPLGRNCYNECVRCRQCIKNAESHNYLPATTKKLLSPLPDLTFPDGLHLFAFLRFYILCQFSIISTSQ